MKRIIEYFYNIKISEIYHDNNIYYFFLGITKYYLCPLNRPIEDLEPLKQLCLELKTKNILTYDLVLNIEGKLYTVYNNVNYVLLKSPKYENQKITYNDINYIMLNTYDIKIDKKLLRNNWINLWSEKIDYYEYQISELSRKYKILHNTIDYYIGLGENAISYLVNNQQKNKQERFILSHKRIKTNYNSFEFYNPLSYIIDSRVRDTTEYIKDAFFNDMIGINEVKNIIIYNNYNYDEYVLFIARLLFPSYYFDIYDEIINNDLDENNIIKIVNKTKDYEIFLSQIISYIISNNIMIEQIDWLKKDA